MVFFHGVETINLEIVNVKQPSLLLGKLEIVRCAYREKEGPYAPVAVR